MLTVSYLHYLRGLSLCTANLPEGPIKISEDDVPTDYMKAVIYTGQQSIRLDGTTGPSLDQE